MRWRFMESEETARQKKLNYIFVLHTSIKGMASYVINYKYHIKTTLLW